MRGKLRSPMAFWIGAIALGVVANIYLWWPQVRPLLRGDCTDLRTVLHSGNLDRNGVRALLGPPSLDAGFHWSYARLCIDPASRRVVDVSVLFRGESVAQVIY